MAPRASTIADTHNTLDMNTLLYWI
jgi:hypothetical protein